MQRFLLHNCYLFLLFLCLSSSLLALNPAEAEELVRQRARVDAQMLELAASSSPDFKQAEDLGSQRARTNHQAALSMLQSLAKGDVRAAQQWRSEIDLPKYGNAVEGGIALARAGSNQNQLPQIAQLLSREYILWQSSRIRQKTDDLLRYLEQQDVSLALVTARASEIHTLSIFPEELFIAAGVKKEQRGKAADPAIVRHFVENAGTDSAEPFRNAILDSLPNLMSAEDLVRRQSLLAKLLRLVPIEYKSGVRDGQVIIPIEYREAVVFTQEASRLFAELRAAWRLEKAEALQKHGARVEGLMASLEQSIRQKQSQQEVEGHVEDLLSLLQDQFGVGLRKSGRSGDVVAESALEIRSLLTQSMTEALAGRWRKAEALRLEAYTTFDLEIERRVLPRDPALAIQAEKMFLEGSVDQLGIKAVLDKREHPQGIQASYQQALSGLEECVAVLRVGLAPKTVAFTAFTIVLREGLEAVVILAALMAGFRGPQHIVTRRRLSAGVWLALLASVITFIIGNTIIQGLSRYGELLEAVVSILAVVILLMVTNWVFHKVYWVEWNARLRELGGKAKANKGGIWEGLSMVGVGFLTIYREGFETTLFLQSLILEGGWGASLSGLLCGLGVIAVLGYAVFYFGAKLPYRKLLVITGVLVVSIMMTFIGSTVRLFQTVGWLPVHPIEGLQFPTWMGLWLGLYPTWEGLLIPLAGIGYVAGAWLFNKWQAKRDKANVTVKSGGEEVPALAGEPFE